MVGEGKQSANSEEIEEVVRIDRVIDIRSEEVKNMSNLGVS